jgi:tripartite-type tricarboxylate transporter receptor subunit TctC
VSWAGAWCAARSWHFAIESLKLGAYRGVASAFTDLISGRVQIMFGTYGSTRQHWESGKLRALAVSTPKRFSDMPERPTIAEVSGIADFALTERYALVAPAAVPAEARARVSQILNGIMSTADDADFNKRFGLEYEPLTPCETQAVMDDELNRASVIAKKAGIKFEQWGTAGERVV